MKPGQLQELEECVNEKIRAHIPVMVQLFSIDDPAVEKVQILHLLVVKETCCPVLSVLHNMYLYKSGEKSRAARGPRRTHSDH